MALFLLTSYMVAEANYMVAEVNYMVAEVSIDHFVCVQLLVFFISFFPAPLGVHIYLFYLLCIILDGFLLF